MAGKLSPKAQIRLNSLREMEDKVQHVYSLVEQYAAAKGKSAEQFAMNVRRAFGRLKLELMGAGLDNLSQLAGSMEMAAKRGGSQVNKLRILREGVGTIRFNIELEQRSVLAEEAAAERAEQEAARKADDDAAS